MSEKKFCQLSVGEWFVRSEGSKEAFRKTEPEKHGPYLCNCIDQYDIPFYVDPAQVVFVLDDEKVN